MENKMAAKKKAVPAKKVAAKKAATPTKKAAPKGDAPKKKSNSGAKPGRPKKQAPKSPVTISATNDGFTINVNTPGINPIAMPSNSTSTNATGSVPGIDVMAAVLASVPEHAKKSILKRLFGIFKRSSKR
jgi:hypothetical protein